MKINSGCSGLHNRHRQDDFQNETIACKQENKPEDG